MPNCCALTDIIDFNYYKDWKSYEEKLYSIFAQDFLLNRPSFKEKNVFIRKHPRVFNKDQTFFHITSKDFKGDDPNNRIPDLRRCERIHWIRPMIEIERYMQCNNHCLKIWIEEIRGRKRIHILNEDDRFMVVLEERKNYFLLITAYYIEYRHTLKKKLKKYQEYIAGHTQMQKTP